MNRRKLWALLILLIFGAVRMPFENQLEAERKAAYFHGAKFDLSLNAQIGQMAFVAALSGFRTPIADGLYLYAHSLWERVEWGRMKLNFDGATALQPRCILFWEQASWHMAFNASVAVFDDKKKEPREALRIKAQHEYWKVGEDYLIRGIANNPDSPALYEKLAFLYQQKFQDHCQAAKLYAQCAQFPSAAVYVHRFAAYELAQCPGHEREAYEQLKTFYLRGEQEHAPTLLKWLGILQEKLKVPPEEKIAIPPVPHP